MNCPLCNTNNVKVVDRNSTYQLIECLECKIVYKHLQEISKKKIEDLQSEVYTIDNLNIRIKSKILEEMALERLHYLKNFIFTGELLEIGPATGNFLINAEKVGFLVTGVELSPIFHNYLKKLGIEVYNSRLEDLEFEDKKFDIVVMFHLIEHIEYPKLFLQEVKRIVRPDGFVFVVTPNLFSQTNNLFGWSHQNYSEVDHLFFFSPEGLAKLFKSEGFDMVSIETREHQTHLFNSIIKFLSRLRNRDDNIMLRVIYAIFTKLGANFLAIVLYPITYIYRKNVCRKSKGHELWAIFRNK